MKTDYSVNDLKERIALQKATVVQDEELNRIPTYSTMKWVYAAMIPKAANIGSTGVANDSRIRYTVVIRKQLTEAEINRIVWRGSNYYPVTPWVVTDRWMIAEFSVEVPDGTAVSLS